MLVCRLLRHSARKWGCINGWVTEFSSMFGRTGDPHFMGPHTRAKKFMRPMLLTSKTKENVSEQTSRKYALLLTQVSHMQT